MPLLQRNRIPGLSDNADDEEKYKKHIELLPEELDPKVYIYIYINNKQSEVYNNIPIDLIGAALLRGMGWKEGMAVGLNCKEAAKIQEVYYIIYYILFIAQIKSSRVRIRCKTCS